MGGGGGGGGDGERERGGGGGVWKRVRKSGSGRVGEGEREGAKGANFVSMCNYLPSNISTCQLFRNLLCICHC